MFISLCLLTALCLANPLFPQTHHPAALPVGSIAPTFREEFLSLMKNRKTAVPKRHEIDLADRWQLEHLFENHVAWEQAYEEAKQKIAEGVAFHDQLHDPDRLLACFAWEDGLDLLIERLYAYAHMRHHEDMTDPDQQALSSKASTLSVHASEATSFITPELLSLPLEYLSKIRDNPTFTVYRHTIDQIMRQKDHILSKNEEALLAKMGNVAQAPGKIYGMINNADLTFPSIHNEHGEEVPLTHSRYIEFMESRDRTVRKSAFETMYATYAKQKNTFAATLHAHVNKNVFYSQVRRFPSVLSASLHSDHIPLSVYDQLITTIHDHLPLLHRYFAVRKRLLRVDELHLYDLFVPIVDKAEQAIPFDDAKELVAQSLAPMGEAYIKLLQEGYRNGWIDVYENEGKRSGAYSWGAYGTHPYVLLNHKDNINALFTLTHEMGHALHSYLSDEAQPYRTAQYTIFLAEVASTLHESLLMNYLLKRTTDIEKRMALLTHYADQFRSTVFRQTMFAEFERTIHHKVENGDTLTPQVLNTLYLDLNKTYFGPSVVIDEPIQFEWARIPHFYSSFYVYKYATGFSAATALAQAILQEGSPAVERTLAFLKSGGSDFSIPLLKKAGVDMNTSAPIVSAMRVFEQIVAEMEQYADRMENKKTS